MVLSLRGSTTTTTTNGGENSSSAEFGEQLTSEEERIMDEIKAEIKQPAYTVNITGENFANIRQTLSALQQQIQIRHPHIKNLNSPSQKFTTIDLSNYTGKGIKITEQQQINNNSTNQESHQEEPYPSDQIVQPSPSPDLSGGVATIDETPLELNSAVDDLSHSGGEMSSVDGDPSIGGGALEVEAVTPTGGERRNDATPIANQVAGRVPPTAISIQAAGDLCREGENQLEPLSEGERRERESPLPETDRRTAAGGAREERRREGTLPVPCVTAGGKSVQAEVMTTIALGGSSSAAARHGGSPSTEKGKNKVARACFGGWHPGSNFVQMGQDQAQVTKERKLGYYFSEGHFFFMSMDQLQPQPREEQDWHVLKFMGQAQRRRGKDGKFGKESE